MGTTLSIKQGDTARKLMDALTLDGAPLDLTGATVKVAWRPYIGGLVTLKTAAIVNAALGQVEYQFVTGDTDIANEYLLEWQVTLPGGGKLSFPSADHHMLKIVEHLMVAP